MISLYHPPFPFYNSPSSFFFPFLNFNLGAWISWYCICKVIFYFVPFLLSLKKRPKITWSPAMGKVLMQLPESLYQVGTIEACVIECQWDRFWHSHILSSFHALFYLGLLCHHSVWMARRQRLYIRCFM